MPTKLAGIKARTAAEIVPHVADFTPASKALLRPEHNPGQYFDVLVEAKKYEDAVRFLAHGIGRREAVWWACVCSRLALEPSPPPPAMNALTAAETWVHRVTEETRRAAQAAAEAEGFNHPASWAAMGAFWSGGSISLPGLPEVPPGPFFTARAVAGSIILSAVRREAEKAPERYRVFLAKGVEICNAVAAQAQGRV